MAATERTIRLVPAASVIRRADDLAL